MDLSDLQSYGSKEYDLYSSMSTKTKHSRCAYVCAINKIMMALSHRLFDNSKCMDLLPCEARVVQESHTAGLSNSPVHLHVSVCFQQV